MGINDESNNNTGITAQEKLSNKLIKENETNK